ncbi:MAG: hypothetical protein JNK82_39270 [Myxococcaceae bacterium]|nr:hypothetical protein [Myxococcaceae bacterium]
MLERKFDRVVQTPPPEPGFIGEGHTAVEVVRSNNLMASDPFVLLMDDRLDIVNRRVIGGAHPHAGLETVTLVLGGVLYAGQPQGEPLIHYGPFIADDEAVLSGMFRDFRAGRFQKPSELHH